MFSLKTYGHSMAPFFRDGDVLMLKKTSFSLLKVNDLVTFKKEDSFITHRVIYISPNRQKQFLIAQGDNNPKHDGKVYSKDIIGRVERVKRGKEFHNPQNLYLMQSTIFFDELVKINKAFEKAGVTFVYLKGLPIWLYLTKTHPKRFYNDADVFIAKEDASLADMILKKLGFQKVSTSLSKGHTFLRGKQINHVYVKKSKQCRVFFDMHVEPIFIMPQLGTLNQLYPQKLVDAVGDDFLRHKKFVKIFGNDFPILRIENLILATLFYLFQHSLHGYFRYEKLHIMLRRKDVDFKLLGRKIARYKLQNFIYPVCLLLKKYYKTPLPSLFLASIKPSKQNLRFIEKNILTKDIFESRSRLSEGVNRFKTFFILSPKPLYQKLFVMFNPAIIYSFIWVLQKRLLRQKNLLFQKLFSKLRYI